MITTIYMVSVDVHDKVYKAFGHTSEFERKSLAATSGSLASGENRYSTVEIWAEFHNRAEARLCEKRIMDLNYYFAAKLL